MAASYPGSVKAFSALIDGSDYPQATHLNQGYDEITAVETALLTTGMAHHVFPGTTALYDLGTSSVKWRDAWLSRNLAVGGTLTIGGLAYTFPASQTANYFLQTNGSGALSWAAGTSQVTMLKQGEGTDTTVGATTVDTIALASGLTVKDSLLVILDSESATQDTAAPLLLNTTDTATILSLNSGNAITAGTITSQVVYITNAESSGTIVSAITYGFPSTNTTQGNGFTNGKRTNFTTAWTGAWTLGLRHGGVTSGGTFKYRWAVYRIAGQ